MRRVCVTLTVSTCRSMSSSMPMSNHLYRASFVNFFTSFRLSCPEVMYKIIIIQYYSFMTNTMLTLVSLIGKLLGSSKLVSEVAFGQV